MAVREVMVVARFEYALQLLAVAAARSEIASEVLYVFRLREFSEI